MVIPALFGYSLTAKSLFLLPIQHIRVFVFQNVSFVLTKCSYLIYFFIFIFVCVYFFSFILISWRIIILQYYSGFCHTLT